jgi:hypothetical protein
MNKLILSQSLPQDSAKWLDEFRQRHGRSPRVLHIGNIANNAYLNAKILNEAGFDCDVICYDYYHIGGCPEWEDADFNVEKIKDQFFPMWLLINTGNFKRPKWFAQGKLKYCILYLIAKRKGKRVQSFFLWQVLNLTSFLVCFVKSHEKCLLTISLLKHITFEFNEIKKLVKTQIQNLIRLNEIKKPVKTQVQNLIRLNEIKKPVKTQVQIIHQVNKDDLYDFEKRCQQLVKIFEQEFPERKDKLTFEELEQYGSVMEQWISLFNYYDLVHAYATDGIIPLIANKPYVAYEHGTIRDLPFQNSVVGRLCALTYKLADQVLITNADNIIAAEKLNLSKYQFVPHPINESCLHENMKSIGKCFYEELHKNMESDFIIFHPARQHWEKKRNPSMDKGNDIFIYGFAKFVHLINPKAKAICVEWGLTLNESKKLIKDLGIENSVVWIKPQNHQKMMQYIHGSDIVADKFCFGGFGGILPKVLMSEKLTLIYMDFSVHEWCFKEMPPVVNVKISEDVFESLAKVYTDPRYRSMLENLGKSWYLNYHSSSIVRTKIQNTYEKILLM